MKKYLAIVPAIIILAGCASAPPTKFESSVFDIQTNFVPKVTIQEVVVPVTKTNFVTMTITNAQNVIEFRTNTVIIPAFLTNSVAVTNLVEERKLTPGAGAREIAATGGAIGNIFGVGPLVSSGILGLFSIWGYLRSKKSMVTAANMAQTIETMRSFVRSLPQGEVYDNELVNWMQRNQANAGVLNEVMSLIQKHVNSDDADTAAEQIKGIISGLSSLTAKK